MRLYGGRVYAKPLSSNRRTAWQWFRLPIPETPPGYADFTLAIPVTPDDFSDFALAIPPTPDEFSDFTLAIRPTPTISATSYCRSARPRSRANG